MRLTINKEAPEGVKVEYKMSGWKIFMIIAGCIIGVIAIGCCVWCWCKRCKAQKEAKNLAKGYQTIAEAQG